MSWRHLAIFLLVATSAGCTNDQSTMVLYSGQHPQLTTSLVAAFEQSTGIKVSVQTGDSIVLTEKLLQEKANTPADVFLAENSPELMLLGQKGLLSVLPAKTLDQVSSKDNSPSGNWVGIAIRISCLVYNPQKLGGQVLPQSVLELANPNWAGKVAIAPSDSDFVPIVSAVSAQHGAAATQAWLQGLKTNAAVYQDIESVVFAVNHGDETVGLINQYYWYRLQLQAGANGIHSNLYYFSNGEAGTVANISGAAITASSKHASQAQQFVDFVVSQAGQQIVAEGDDFEYPIRPGIAANPSIPPLSSIPTAPITPAQLGDDQTAAQLLRSAGLT